MDYAERESRVTEILNDKDLRELMSLMENHNGILSMFLLYMDKGRWGNAKKYKTEKKLSLSDNTFRVRMKEAEDLKLAKSEPLKIKISHDPLKKEWGETELGYKVNEALLGFFYKVRQIYKKHNG